MFQIRPKKENKFGVVLSSVFVAWYDSLRCPTVAKPTKTNEVSKKPIPYLNRCLNVLEWRFTAIPVN